MSAVQDPIDYVVLANFLDALSYPLRLALLDQLRTPRTLGELRVPVHRTIRGQQAKTASRPTVLGHLDKLVKADLVHAEPIALGRRTAPCYVVNPMKLYALTEDLRRITTQHAGRGPAGDVTGTLGNAPPPHQSAGPRLVLVHGAYEGKSFALEHAGSTDGAWTIGRRRGLAVSLDYDPYVSLENSQVAQRGGQFVLTDLRSSKNGTTVNWRPLPRGGSQVLRSADVIGVGRSLLVFAAS